MIFELRPAHVARALAALCALPILWTFAVEGITTTTEYDYSTGEVSSSSDLSSQIGSVAIWIVLAIVFAAGAWYLEKQHTDWPPAAHEQLVKLQLASPSRDE
ncbi:hypothetical protein [Rhodococcus erythropolis]|uniref:hypothetical protein n=1 Tax=Rhodococcus erythropolis TaxID=1833 RepID=UPI001BE5F6D4|nr:hypothetical protein [Rhodococcus erythropolis]MBT2268633.1 hypothetical protein [Rhodococcus erythropolis]